MQKSAVIVLSIIAVIGVAGAAIVLSGDSNDDTQANVSTQESTPASSPQASTPSTATPAAEAEATETESSDDSAATSAYITLAEYNADKAAYADKNKVLFFHADWCPTCRAVENEIKEDMSRVPADTVFIETNYDDETALRQQYGVTTQTTFVQIDNDGNEIAQWWASTLDRALAEVQS